MIEVLVWLLVSTGSNSASHTVGQFKTAASCNEVKKDLFDPSRSRCIQANIYIPAPQGGKQ